MSPIGCRRGGDPCELWRSPHLLFAQTCGFPLMHEFAGKLTLVATPCYSASGGEGPNYRSFIVVRANDPRGAFAEFRGAVAAINSEDSHSGCNILRWRDGEGGQRAVFRSRGTDRRSCQQPCCRAVGQGGRRRHRLRHLCLVAAASGQRRCGSSRIGGNAFGSSAAIHHRGRHDGTGIETAEAGARGDAWRSCASGCLPALLLGGVEEVPLAGYGIIRDFAREGEAVAF